ncbi:metalloprotease MEP1 [Colletotrichum sojae]|uniref:Metalloprotease MEP1 n=1 Tax=Colletotrichum sojae TaxID=2175907 RepID=A0A8H6JS70_9PEZI|nr:metalloprotease MEP1 [Colletotrichum sojae]
MRVSWALLPLSTLIANAFSSPTEGQQQPARCGTRIADKSFARTFPKVQAYEKSIKLRARDDSSQPGSLPPIDVTVYFHTVSSRDKTDVIKDEILEKQFAVLQETYAVYDVRMHWDRVVASRTVDDFLATFAWPLTGERVELKKRFLSSTRKGGYNALNFYFYTDMPTGEWGSCNLPQDNVTASFDDMTFREDGCNINYVATPGGPNPIVNQGKTAIHEAGHWFGLKHVFHTYQCDDEGDTIDDTPAASTLTEGCPIGKDSCPDSPGLDPIHNYMDYSDDYCLTEFTPQQKIRMHATWTTLRSNMTAVPR